MKNHGINNQVQVKSAFFFPAGKELEKMGLLTIKRVGMDGINYRCGTSGRLVGAYSSLGYGAGVAYLDEEFFRNITVETRRSRPMNGTEYEMLCRKLEARSRGGGQDISLPEWTKTIYDKAISDGLTSFRGRTALVNIPYSITLQQAIISEAVEHRLDGGGFVVRPRG